MPLKRSSSLKSLKNFTQSFISSGKKDTTTISSDRLSQDSSASSNSKGRSGKLTRTGSTPNLQGKGSATDFNLTNKKPTKKNSLTTNKAKKNSTLSAPNPQKKRNGLKKSMSCKSLVQSTPRKGHGGRNDDDSSDDDDSSYERSRPVKKKTGLGLLKKSGSLSALATMAAEKNKEADPQRRAYQAALRKTGSTAKLRKRNQPQTTPAGGGPTNSHWQSSGNQSMQPPSSGLKSMIPGRNSTAMSSGLGSMPMSSGLQDMLAKSGVEFMSMSNSSLQNSSSNLQNAMISSGLRSKALNSNSLKNALISDLLSPRVPAALGQPPVSRHNLNSERIKNVIGNNSSCAIDNMTSATSSDDYSLTDDEDSSLDGSVASLAEEDLLKLYSKGGAKTNTNANTDKVGPSKASSTSDKPVVGSAQSTSSGELDELESEKAELAKLIERLEQENNEMENKLRETEKANQIKRQNSASKLADLAEPATNKPPETNKPAGQQQNAQYRQFLRPSAATDEVSPQQPPKRQINKAIGSPSSDLMAQLEQQVKEIETRAKLIGIEPVISPPPLAQDSPASKALPGTSSGGGLRSAKSLLDLQAEVQGLTGGGTDATRSDEKSAYASTSHIKSAMKRDPDTSATTSGRDELSQSLHRPQSTNNRQGGLSKSLHNPNVTRSPQQAQIRYGSNGALNFDVNQTSGTSANGNALDILNDHIDDIFSPSGSDDDEDSSSSDGDSHPFASRVLDPNESDTDEEDVPEMPKSGRQPIASHEAQQFPSMESRPLDEQPKKTETPSNVLLGMEPQASCTQYQSTSKSSAHSRARSEKSDAPSTSRSHETNGSHNGPNNIKEKQSVVGIESTRSKDADGTQDFLYPVRHQRRGVQRSQRMETRSLVSQDTTSQTSLALSLPATTTSAPSQARSKKRDIENWLTANISRRSQRLSTAEDPPDMQRETKPQRSRGSRCLPTTDDQQSGYPSDEGDVCEKPSDDEESVSISSCESSSSESSFEVPPKVPRTISFKDLEGQMSIQSDAMTADLEFSEEEHLPLPSDMPCDEARPPSTDVGLDYSAHGANTNSKFEQSLIEKGEKVPLDKCVLKPSIADEQEQLKLRVGTAEQNSSTRLPSPPKHTTNLNLAVNEMQQTSNTQSQKEKEAPIEAGIISPSVQLSSQDDDLDDDLHSAVEALPKPATLRVPGRDVEVTSATTRTKKTQAMAAFDGVKTEPIALTQGPRTATETATVSARPSALGSQPIQNVAYSQQETNPSLKYENSYQSVEMSITVEDLERFNPVKSQEVVVTTVAKGKEPEEFVPEPAAELPPTVGTEEYDYVHLLQKNSKKATRRANQLEPQEYRAVPTPPQVQAKEQDPAVPGSSSTIPYAEMFASSRSLKGQKPDPSPRAYIAPTVQDEAPKDKKIQKETSAKSQDEQPTADSSAHTATFDSSSPLDGEKVGVFFAEHETTSTNPPLDADAKQGPKAKESKSIESVGGGKVKSSSSLTGENQGASWRTQEKTPSPVKKEEDNPRKANELEVSEPSTSHWLLDSISRRAGNNKSVHVPNQSDPPQHIRTKQEPPEFYRPPVTENPTSEATETVENNTVMDHDNAKANVDTPFSSPEDADIMSCSEEQEQADNTQIPISIPVTVQEHEENCRQPNIVAAIAPPQSILAKSKFPEVDPAEYIRANRSEIGKKPDVIFPNPRFRDDDVSAITGFHSPLRNKATVSYSNTNTSPAKPIKEWKQSSETSRSVSTTAKESEAEAMEMRMSNHSHVSSYDGSGHGRRRHRNPASHSFARRVPFVDPGTTYDDSQDNQHNEEDTLLKGGEEDISNKNNVMLMKYYSQGDDTLHSSGDTTLSFDMSFDESGDPTEKSEKRRSASRRARSRSKERHGRRNSKDRLREKNHSDDELEVKRKKPKGTSWKEMLDAKQASGKKSKLRTSASKSPSRRSSEMSPRRSKRHSSDQSPRRSSSDTLSPAKSSRRRSRSKDKVLKRQSSRESLRDEISVQKKNKKDKKSKEEKKFRDEISSKPSKSSSKKSSSESKKEKKSSSSKNITTSDVDKKDRYNDDRSKLLVKSSSKRKLKKEKSKRSLKEPQPVLVDASARRRQLCDEVSLSVDVHSWDGGKKRSY